jgi:hypothetical protein
MAKRLALCIASRGNPRLLLETVIANLRGCSLPATTIVAGLDEDDPALPETRTLLERAGQKRIIMSVASRADTIGAVYNRCASTIDADLYINGADDVRIATPGWDLKLTRAAEAFLDNIGIIGFGQMPVQSTLPVLAAVTRGLVAKMGYFQQDYTPFWWIDTWLYEIAAMIGRVQYADIDVACIGPMKTRGLREVTYWAAFFDEMRSHRRSIAETILSSPDFLETADRKQALRRELDLICAEFENGNANLRDPIYVKPLEGVGHDAPDDGRYRRVKEHSLRMLQELGKDCTQLA